ncbi:MAG: hypothetical protein NVS4B3_25250 [Gemmatimonadaceae bacterium]
MLIAESSLFLVPAALVLHRRPAIAQSTRLRITTACGTTSLLLCAYRGYTHAISRTLEVSYIALSGVWRCALGAALRAATRRVGTVTFILGLFALWDTLLTSIEPVPVALYATAPPKMRLSIIWDGLVASVLLRATEQTFTNDRRAQW